MILLLCTYCDVPGVPIGFPWRKAVKPWLQLCRAVATTVAERKNQTFTTHTAKTEGDPSTINPATIKHLDLLDAVEKAKASQEMATNGPQMPGGMSHLDRTNFNELEVLNSLRYRPRLRRFHPVLRQVDSEALFSWVSLGPTPSDILPSGLVNRDHMSSQPGACKGRVFPRCLGLLKEFRPWKWADEVIEELSSAWEELRVYLPRAAGAPHPIQGHMAAKNLLWTQLYLLDEDIRALVDEMLGRGERVWHLHEEKAFRNEQARAKADEIGGKSLEMLIIEAVHSSRITAVGEGTGSAKSNKEGEMAEDPWDLEAALLAQDGIPSGTDDQKARIRALADLLKLRALFFMVYLMLMPESTAVYQCKESPVAMPMM
jgi:hypothetical protein